MLESVTTQIQFFSDTTISALICLGLGFVFNFSSSFGMSGAIGLFTVGSAALLINFVAPINAVFSVFMISLSLFGWIRFVRNRDKTTFLNQFKILFISIFVFWLIGLRREVHSDAGLYHIPMIHWIQSESLPIGLGLLHDRFGSWNFWLSVCAAMNAGSILKHSAYSMNILLMAFATTDFYRWGKNEKNPSHYFSIGLFLYFAFLDTWYIGGGQKSPNADFAGAVLVAWVFSYFIQRNNDDHGWVKPVIFLGGMSLLIKLNLVPIVVIVLFAFVHQFKRNRKNIPWLLITSIFVVGVLSVIKSFWTTGCLIFPAKSTCFPVSWRIPEESINNYYGWVIRWARWPEGTVNQVLNSWEWLPHWWDGNKKIQVISCTIWTSLVFVVLKLIFKKRILSIDWLAICVALSGVFMWFITAPDIRFAYGYFIVLISLMWSPLLEFVNRVLPRLKLKRWLVGIALVLLVNFLLIQIRKSNDFGASTLIEPSPANVIKYNRKNQSVTTPGSNDQCWRLPPPCTPYFNENLVYSDWGIWRKFQYLPQ